MGYRVDVVLYAEIRIVELFSVIDVLFCLLAYLGHDLDGTDRISAGSRLRREHDGRRSVVYRVRNVGDLGPRRTGIADHRFEHLGRRYHAFAEHTADGNELFLSCRDLLERDLDAEVSAGDHHAAADLADLKYVVDAGLVFNLRYDIDALAAVFIYETAHVLDVLTVRNERGGDVIDLVFDAEKQVALILFRQEHLMQHLAGERHGLSVGDRPAFGDDAFYIVTRDLLYGKLDETVVHEHGVARRELVAERFV